MRKLLAILALLCSTVLEIRAEGSDVSMPDKAAAFAASPYQPMFLFVRCAPLS